MDPSRWEIVQQLFHHASALPPSEREAFLHSASVHDPALIGEVLSMLTFDQAGASIIDRGLPEIAARILDDAESVREMDFGPYRLKKLLGEGGMGVVWLAERLDVGNLVAIKFLPHAGLSPARRERFSREIRTLAKLSHPYIARLYDAGALKDGTPWFVMEYVEGMPLSDYCRQRAQPILRRLKLFRQICEGAQYAHSQEIIHRDLKPSNIMVAKDDTPRLLDFGIARELHQLEHAGDLTKAGLRFFSAAYSAPEWAQDGVVSFAIDVYSLGALLYEMLTGDVPRTAGHSSVGDRDRQTVERPSVVVQRAQRSVENLSTAAWRELDVLCLKALHPDPKQRYASIEALMRDLDHYQNHEPLEARPGKLSYRANRFLRRNRAAVTMISAVALLLAGLTIFFTVRLARARDAALAQAVRERRIQQFMLDLFQGGDKDAGPAANMRVVSLIDRGAQQARTLDAEPQVQADLYETLGLMYQRLGRFDRAAPLLQTALEKSKSLRDADQAQLTVKLLDLALLQSDQGNQKDAEKTVQLGVDHARSVKNPTLMARAQAAQGMVLVNAGQYSLALEPLSEAASVQEKTNPPSSDLAETLGSLGDAQLYLGHYPQAEDLYRRAEVIHRHTDGENHPKVAEDLANIAGVEETEGHYDEAEKNEREGLRMVSAWYGVDHPATARQMTELASTLLYEMKNTHDPKYVEANSLLRQALVIQERVYGSASVHVAYVLNSLGAAADYGHHYSQAEDYFQRVSAIYKSAYSASDYRYGVALANLASIYQKDKRYAQAESLLIQATQINTAALGAENINTAIDQIKLGRVFEHENRYREAEPHTRAGFEALIRQTSPDTDFVQGASKDLILAYGKLNEPQKAEEIKRTVASLMAKKGK